MKTALEKIVLFGNGPFAESMYFLLKHDSACEVVAFTVDSAYIRQDSLCGVPVVPFESVERLFPPSDYKMLVALSFQKVNRLREEKYLQAKAKGYSFVNYVSSRAVLYPGLCIGENCIILENTIISPFVEIGNNVFIGHSVTLAHHVRVKDHCFLSPGAILLGRVIVEEYCLIGANATIKEEVKVAGQCVVGSGSVILKNTRPKDVYVSPPVNLHPMRSDVLSKWLTWPARTASSATEDQPAREAHDIPTAAET